MESEYNSEGILLSQDDAKQLKAVKYLYLSHLERPQSTYMNASGFQLY